MTTLIRTLVIVAVVVGIPLAVAYQWPAVLLAVILVAYWRHLIYLDDTSSTTRKENRS